MKIARPLMALMLACAAVPTAASADTYSTAAREDDPDADKRSHIVQDAYGAPLSLNQPKKTSEPTQAEVEAGQKQQAQAEKDRDWLLRSYERQLHVNSPDLSGDKNK